MASPIALCPIVSTASRVPTRARGVSRCPLVSTFGCAPGRLQTASPRKSATGRVSRVAVPRAVSDERAPHSDYYDAAAHPNNVYHEPVSGTPPPAQSHAFASNPGQPGHLPEMGATRQRLVDREAAAVQTRDYATASAAAGLLARLVQIEHELMHHDTAEMEASLAQDYQTAALAKRRKDLLLAEFETIRADRAGDAFADPNVSSGPAGGGDGRPAAADDGTGDGAVAAAPGYAGCPVRFNCNVQPQFGESVVVCGDAPELGGWDGKMGVPMEYQMDSKTWSATVMMPQASRFKFKFVVVGGRSPEEEAEGAERALYWQEGDDRFVQLPFDDALSLDIVIDWEGDSEKERMWLCMPVPQTPPES